jgi:hypothetical protein
MPPAHSEIRSTAAVTGSATATDGSGAVPGGEKAENAPRPAPSTEPPAAVVARLSAVPDTTTAPRATASTP